MSLEFYNNDALDEMFDIINMLGKGKHIVFDNSKEAIEEQRTHQFTFSFDEVGQRAIQLGQTDIHRWQCFCANKL